MTEPCWFWIVAGSNGAGKSTYAETILRVPIIDPDNPTPGAALDPFSAGRQTLTWVQEQIAAKQSFGVETTLSGLGYLRTARDLKEQGWSCGLVYVGLASADLAVQRVAARFQIGGHTVPESDIRRRYERSLRNLPMALALADIALILDNTKRDPGFRLVMDVRERQTVFRADPLPTWLASALARKP
jgi:predicted ABC-type ATPase